MDPLTILAIESTCDDTSVGIVSGLPGHAKVLSNIVEGQATLHQQFGGVVPEIAARAHVEKLDSCAERALDEAGLTLAEVDAIGCSAGPGLIGGVMSGVMFAKGLAAGSGKPLIGVNHLAGHALTPRLTDGIAYPYLMLLVSGGHCQFLLVEDHDRFTRLGGTIDDAPGEAFDKAGRLLALTGGGPAVEEAARSGDPERVSLPRPLLDRDDCDMSFSGLKTALLRARDTLLTADHALHRQDQADLAAGFQAAVRDVLAGKTTRALAQCSDITGLAPTLAVAGGVAANRAIREALQSVADDAGSSFVAPPLALCTDNGAMIAYAALERFAAGKSDDLTLAARPRWPLDDKAAAMLGSGKKGAKA